MFPNAIPHARATGADGETAGRPYAALLPGDPAHRLRVLRSMVNIQTKCPQDWSEVLAYLGYMLSTSDRKTRRCTGVTLERAASEALVYEGMTSLFNNASDVLRIYSKKEADGTNKQTPVRP